MSWPGGYLLDTNVILALVCRNGLGRFLDAAYGINALAHQFTVAIVTVGELYAWRTSSNGDRLGVRPWRGKSLCSICNTSISE